MIAIAALVGSLCAKPALPAGQPNIVLIISDDAGYNEFGFTAALNGLTTQFETPNLDALASESVVGRQGYVAHPLCSPSRAGLLTGQYPQRFGFEGNLATNWSPGVNDTTGLTVDNKIMPQYLKERGYTTGMVGKWHLGYQDGINVPLDKGFDEFYGLWGGGRPYFFATDSTIDHAYMMRRGDAPYETASRTEGTAADYDPLRGRYVTDAFGEEAVNFINAHADDPNPFFLYLSFTAPHTPIDAKQSDLDHFANISDPSKRTLAAMTYALDRNIGKVREALAANNIDDNTILVFLNDNGGLDFNDNRPFNGSKGLTWEGGVRVPFIIRAPGVQAGVYDAPISSLDLLPTFYAASGGDVADLDTDGADLLPHLNGSIAGTPHDMLVWRNGTQWGIRKGDWKLGNPGGSTGTVLFNIATDQGETTNVLNQHPEIVEELKRDFTDWEVTTHKAKWGFEPFISKYDHFIFRTDLLPTNPNVFYSFSSGLIWRDAVIGAPTGVNRSDSYANLILEFPVKDGGNYYIDFNILRVSQQTFMLNEVRFTGDFTGTSNFAGTLRSLTAENAVLFVQNLEGSLPKVRLDATSSGTTKRFTFNIDYQLLLYNDLEITGNGTQNFFINGAIKDYYHPRGVIKSGTSSVTLTGHNTFHGDLRIEGGQVRLSGAGSAINGAASIQIGSAGSLVQNGGLIATHTLDNSVGGSFQFQSGELRVVDFVGNLTNEGGNYSPGASASASSISGNFVQTGPAAKLTMELGGTIPGFDYDQLTIGGTATLGGTLQIDLLSSFLPQRGDVYVLLDTLGGITGSFANTILPALSGGDTWRLEYGQFRLRLIVEPQGGGGSGPIAGDYNRDGVVDSADFVVWRKSFGSTTLLDADGDQDGAIDDDDYLVWRRNYGNTAPTLPSRSSAIVGVPEPNTALLAVLAGLGAANEIRRRVV